MLADLLARNAKWSGSRTQSEPDYFARLATQQSPEFFGSGAQIAGCLPTLWPGLIQVKCLCIAMSPMLFIRPT